MLRFARRCLVVYVVLVSFPAPVQYLPKLSWIGDDIDAMWAPLVTWIGEHVLGQPITVLPNGSGDTTFNYVELACFAAIAAALGAIWTLIDRRRRDDARLIAWLRYYVALVVGLTMLVYGLDKVLVLQMSPPGPSDLARPLGRYSPMGLLWNFVGASSPYQIFGGVLETLGAALVFFRSTVRVGALVLAPVLLNVVMFNLCYDIPVKLYSSQLLAMVLWLLVPDLRRLIDVVVLRRVPPPEPALMPLVDRPWAKRATTAFSAFWLAIGATTLAVSMLSRRGERDAQRETPLLGTYRAATAVDGRQIRRISIDGTTSLAVEREDGSVRVYTIATDLAKHAVTIQDEHAAPISTLTYVQPSVDALELDGSLDGVRVHLQLRRADALYERLDTWHVHAIHETVPPDEPEEPTPRP